MRRGDLLSPHLSPVERLRRTERVVSFIRLGVVLFNVASYQLLAPESDRRGLANVICVLATLYAFATLAVRPTRELTFAYALTNMILDNVLIGVWLYATGGFSSPYYPLFYAEVAASIGRFGSLAGNLSGVGSSLIYLIVVGIDGFEGTSYRLPVRIAYIFLIAAFVSYVVEVARRSEREVLEAERETAAYMELDRMRGTFVTNISHELRTPLTAIRGAAATLARRPTLSEKENTTLVEMIDRQSGRLAALVQDIIDIGLVEQGRLIPNMAWADMVAVVREEVEAARIFTDRRIELVPPLGEVRAFCDGQKVGNALGKVINNALKFSDPQSVVTVKLEVTDGEVRISVADRGIGVHPADLDRIFDRFHQVDSSHTRPAGGTGIGLSIARTILEVHGGTIDVTSREGEGSRFFLRFPADGSDKALDRLLRGSRAPENVRIESEPRPE